MLKGVLLFGLSLVTHLYTTFVLTVLWNWFIVPAFHVPEISFWLAYGVILVLGLFQDPNEKNFSEDRRWKGLMTAIDTCIPEDRRAAVMEELADQKKEIWVDLGVLIFARAFGNTLTLAIAFVVHVLAST